MIGALNAIVFQSGLSDRENQYMAREIAELDWRDGRHYDFMDIGGVLARDPAVIEAVTRMLGAGWRLDPERRLALHINPPHTPASDWHADRYWDDVLPWPPGDHAYLFYYPQDTPLEMGPTVVWTYDGRELAAAGPAGTCLLMRQDAWHRALANTTGSTRKIPGRTRYMLRIMFENAEVK